MFRRLSRFSALAGLAVLCAGDQLWADDSKSGCRLETEHIQNIRNWSRDPKDRKSEQATMDWFLSHVLGGDDRCKCIKKYRDQQYEIWNAGRDGSTSELVCAPSSSATLPDAGVASQNSQQVGKILSAGGLSPNDPRLVMMGEAKRLAAEMRERISSDVDVIEEELKKLKIKDISLQDVDEIAETWGNHVLGGGASGDFGGYIKQYVSQQGVCEYYYGTPEKDLKNCNFRTVKKGTLKGLSNASTEAGCKSLDQQCRDEFWGITPFAPSMVKDDSPAVKLAQDHSPLFDRPVVWMNYVDKRSHNMRCGFYEMYFEGQCPKKIKADDFFDFLLTTARADANGKFFDRGITPYHARMLAIHAIEREVRKRYGNEADAKLNAFAAKLKMKHGPSPGSAPTSFKNSFFMNGYALASNSAGTAKIFAPNSTFGSTECSASMARLMALADPKHLSGYSDTTAGMAAKNYACFDRVDLLNEIQLQPGDVVVEREPGQTIGHTFIFMGWKKTFNGTQMSIIHSTGGANRSAMIEQSFPSDDKPLYVDDDCEMNSIFRGLTDETSGRSHNKKQPGDDNQPKAQFQIIRPKTGKAAGDCFYEKK